jgi:ADP-heptose:LPS heptosyltransferase
VLQETDLQVPLLIDDPEVRRSTADCVADCERFRLVEGCIAFDTFDALLSFCTIFVGKDPGPKHLAALRGTPLVRLHSARTNWNECGQEVAGSVISRRVPCAGCSLSYDSECGKAFACVRDFSVEEVFSAIVQLLVRTRPSLPLRSLQ